MGSLCRSFCCYKLFDGCSLNDAVLFLCFLSWYNSFKACESDMLEFAGQYTLHIFLKGEIMLPCLVACQISLLAFGGELMPPPKSTSFQTKGSPSVVGCFFFWGGGRGGEDVQIILFEKL